MRQGLSVVGLVAASLVVSPAFAETPDADAAEIVVTGTRVDLPTSTGSKTGTDPRDVPAAIVIIPAEVLKGQGAITLNDALTNASSVTPVFGGGYGLADNYLIRGLAMRFLRDGLPDGPTFVGYRRSLADIASIEVLKGPGSALYGRAEAGGTVNLTTRGPRDAFGVEGEASYGRYDTVSLTGDIGGPLTRDVRSRLIGHYERTDGYRGLGRRITEVLPTLAVDLSPNNVLTFDYDYRDSFVRTDNYGIPFTTARQFASVAPETRLYSPFNRVDQTIHRFTVSDVAQLAPDMTVRAALVYDTRKIDLTRNAGANAVNTAGVITGRGGRTQQDAADYWTGQLETVFTPQTGALKHTILFGIEYSGQNIATRRRTYALPNLSIVNGTATPTETAAVLSTAVLAFDRRIAADTLSVYGQEQVDIADTVKVRAGVRYDDVKLVDAGFSGTATRRIAGNEGLWSWQIGAVYQPAKWLSLYSGYAKGKFISVQTESGALSPIPESSSQIEVGVKAELIPGKLNANVAMFETRRSDYFVTLVAGADPVQVGKQRSRGVELDLIGTPLPGLGIIANAAYIDAINQSSALATITGIATNQSIFGKQLGSTPRFSGSVWGEYVVPSGTLAGFTLGAGVTYKGAVFADSLELLRVPDYAIARAAIGYWSKHFDAQLTVSNLTDAHYYSVPTFVGAQPGEPRAFQFTVRTRF